MIIKFINFLIVIQFMFKTIFKFMEKLLQERFGMLFIINRYKKLKFSFEIIHGYIHQGIDFYYYYEISKNLTSVWSFKNLTSY